jgi:hypothetical protein
LTDIADANEALDVADDVEEWQRATRRAAQEHEKAVSEALRSSGG